MTELNQCDYDKVKQKDLHYILKNLHFQSKYKHIVLKLYNILEDSFGEYVIRNVMGQSKPVRLLQTLDGSWSQWSDWSACSKSCLSQSDGLGEKVGSQCNI